MVEMVIGCIMGCVITLLIMHFTSAHGTLKIDLNNPDKDTYRIVIDELESLEVHDRMILDIVREDLSQE